MAKLKVRSDYDAKIIGRNLKRLRLKAGYSVDDIREYLGLGTVQAVYKHERGLSYPAADEMLALMELYGACVSDIIMNKTTPDFHIEFIPDIIEDGQAKKLDRLKTYYIRITDLFPAT
ncbi:MAG: helix-turn-helix transcriptional regulator [Lachnospiraceae bacterium]|nr:helix-turn-helix transcriptional regulator [Lachnospiraceae bacterium]